ncbi:MULTISPECIES: hypothetical protein [Streptomyces]|uniref:hypothetical protein n=1 Tax=Streptomyces TaxID=1883 RepID=UPI00115F7FEC|nr:hypothetical protein [Streptomyces sp. PAN_FS17]
MTAFTALAITMLVLGQTVTAIGALIPAVAMGVQQLMQAVEGKGPGRPLPSPAPLTAVAESDCGKGEDDPERQRL